MINELQRKLLEVLAPSALAIASIFFAVLMFFFGAVTTLLKESERRPLRLGIGITYGFTLASLLSAVIALIAMRFQTVYPYKLTLLAAGVTLAGMFVLATFMLLRTFQK